MDTATLIAQAYEEAELRLTALLARRAAAGMSSGYDLWARRKLAEIQALRRAVQAQIADLESVTARLLLEGFTEAAREAVAAASADVLRVTGQTTPAIAGDPRVIRLLAEETASRLQVSHLAVLRQTDDAYRQIMAQVGARMATGTLTLPQAVQQALFQFAGRGITGFTDRAGRSWGLREYAEMTVRTSEMAARTNAALTRYGQLGHDLVIVSDSPDECPICRGYEGKVLSIKGDGQHQTVAEATGAGLFHANCTHSLGVWVEGLSRPLHAEANPQGYEERQRQRYLERRVRDWRRREAAAVTEGGRRQARAGLTRARAAHDEFIARTDRLRQGNRLYLMRGA
jgi:hypothetical protein